MGAKKKGKKKCYSTEDNQAVEKVGPKTRRQDKEEAAIDQVVQNEVDSRAAQKLPNTDLDSKEAAQTSTMQMVVSSSQPPHEKKNVGRANYMSNLCALVRVVNMADLKEPHLLSISEYCPFSKLIHAIANKVIKGSMVRKDDNVIQAIIKCYDIEVKGNLFKFEGTHKCLKKDDISAIFGISDGNDKIVVVAKKTKKNAFHMRYFAEETGSLSKAVIKTALEIAIKGDTPRDYSDVTSLLTLYCLVSLFIPKRNSLLGWDYVRLVSDLDNLKKYDWSGHIYETLLNSIKKEMCGGSINQVVGCVLALPFWYMECFQNYLPGNPFESMLCLKWDMRSLKKMIKEGKINGIHVEGVKAIEDEKDDRHEEEEEEEEEAHETEFNEEEEQVRSEEEQVRSEEEQVRSEEDSGREEDAETETNQEVVATSKLKKTNQEVVATSKLKRTSKRLAAKNIV